MYSVGQLRFVIYYALKNAPDRSENKRYVPQFVIIWPEGVVAFFVRVAVAHDEGVSLKIIFWA